MQWGWFFFLVTSLAACSTAVKTHDFHQTLNTTYQFEQKNYDDNRSLDWLHCVQLKKDNHEKIFDCD